MTIHVTDNGDQPDLKSVLPVGTLVISGASRNIGLVVQHFPDNNTYDVLLLTNQNRPMGAPHVLRGFARDHFNVCTDGVTVSINNRKDKNDCSR